MSQKQKFKYIFFSHSNENLNIVDQLIALLKNAEVGKFKSFCSSRNGEGVNAGEKLNKKILKAIQKATDLVYIITQDFLKSSYCIQELGVGCICKGKKYYLLTPEVELSDLDGFVNSKNDVFLYVDSIKDTENLLNTISSKEIKSSLSSNVTRTFISAIKGDIDMLQLHKEEKYAKEQEETNRINALQEKNESLKEEKAELERSYKAEKAAMNIAHEKETAGECLEILVEILSEFYVSNDFDRFLSLGKDIWLFIINKFEELSEKSKLERLDSYDIAQQFAFALIKYSEQEKAYKYMIKYIKLCDYIYIHQIEYFIDNYHGDLHEILRIIEEKFSKMSPSKVKDETKKTIDYLKSLIEKK